MRNLTNGWKSENGSPRTQKNRDFYLLLRLFMAFINHVLCTNLLSFFRQFLFLFD